MILTVTLVPRDNGVTAVQAEFVDARVLSGVALGTQNFSGRREWKSWSAAEGLFHCQQFRILSAISRTKPARIVPNGPNRGRDRFAVDVKRVWLRRPPLSL